MFSWHFLPAAVLLFTFQTQIVELRCVLFLL